MGFFDFRKSKKKKDAAVPLDEAAGMMSLDDADLSGIEPPETRYTQEYQDYLATQEKEAPCAAAPEGSEEEEP